MNRTTLWLCTLCMAVATPVLLNAQCTPVGCSKDLIAIGNDSIAFHCVWYDHPVPGQSTWYYKVTSGTAPAISHVDFQLDLGCVSVVESGTWGPTKNDKVPGAGMPQVVDPDPTTGLSGLKFDQGFADGESRWYYFTIDTNVEASNNTVMASKGGPTYDLGTICGPAMGCTPLCTNGASPPENLTWSLWGTHQYLISWDPVVCGIGYQICVARGLHAGLRVLPPPRRGRRRSRRDQQGVQSAAGR